MSPALQRHRIPELDGLRGSAILLVVLYHYICGGFSQEDHSILANFFHSILPLAWTGVDLFFVLSGFLIGGILMDYRDSEVYFSTFYIRRFCRILPLYFLWLGLLVFLLSVCTPHLPPEWYSTVFLRTVPHIHRWEYFVFLQNFYIAKTSLFGSSWLAATWSLAVEEQFYLLLPLAIWLVPPRKLPWVLVTLIVLVPVFRICLYLFYPAFLAYVLLPARADALLLGTLAAWLLRNNAARTFLKARQNQLYLALVILFAGMGCLTAFAAGQGNLKLLTSFEMVTFGYSWVAIFYACLLLATIIDPPGIIASMMRLPWLRHFGVIAFGVFLMHMAINNLAHGLLLGKESVTMENVPDAFATLLAFLATWLLAALSWNFLEKPIVTWGHSFSYNRAKASAQ